VKNISTDLLEEQKASFERWVKLGDCFARIGHIREAKLHYEKAETILLRLTEFVDVMTFPPDEK